MRTFSLLIKPASADCNLRCPYCFYLDRSELYPDSRVHRMSLDVLERVIPTYMATDQPQYAFGWQGGEPTLMGVEFFRKVVELQQRYGKSGSVVSNGLQTNAILIDDEFAEHFAEYNFLVGVSLDGPEEIHDKYRVNAAGCGSHADVLRGIECLKRNKIEFNVLCLVNAANVGQGGAVYRYLRDLGLFYHQYIPCVEFGPDDGQLLPFAVTGEEWGRFLCEVFDEWVRADTRMVSIRLFDSILALMVDGVRNVCCISGDCRQYFVVEHNGDVYPCDFFVDADKKLGNVMECGIWDGLFESPMYREFGGRKSRWNEQCGMCRYLEYCQGDCLKHRMSKGSSSAGLSVLCDGWRMFFEHALPGLKRLASELQAERRRQEAASLRMSVSGGNVGRIGRNDLCPCGSGKKYKKCHGR